MPDGCISIQSIISRQMRTRMQEVNGIQTGCRVENMQISVSMHIKRSTGGWQTYDSGRYTGFHRDPESGRTCILWENARENGKSHRRVKQQTPVCGAYSIRRCAIWKIWYQTYHTTDPLEQVKQGYGEGNYRTVWQDPANTGCGNKWREDQVLHADVWTAGYRNRFIS